MAKRGRTSSTDRDRIEREAKRAEQKEAGVFDGRFRPRVVKDKKKYTRKRPPPGAEEN